MCPYLCTAFFVVDNPSVLIVSDLTDNSNPLVFSFKEKDWVVSPNEGSRQQSITRHYASNTSYFAEDEIIGG